MNDAQLVCSPLNYLIRAP